MAWTTPRTWVTSEVVTASVMNTHVRDNFNETAPAQVSATSQYIVSDGANSLVARTISQDNVLTSETTTSTSFTDLATSGPAVTVTTGTSALILMTCRLSNSGTNASYMSYAISGASTASATSARSIEYRSASATYAHSGTYANLHGGLTAGSNTFTAKYSVSAGTGTFANRRITIYPL